MTVRTAGSLAPTVEEVLATDIDRWPLLIRALKDKGMAEATKVEWLTTVSTPCPTCGSPHVKREIEFNYTEIFRTPVKKDESTFDALKRHLDSIETALRSGLRSRNVVGPLPFTGMGGVISLLGRWPHKDDFLSLKVLRDPFLMKTERDRYDVPLDTTRFEWISEMSLMAVKGTS